MTMSADLTDRKVNSAVSSISKTWNERHPKIFTLPEVMCLECGGAKSNSGVFLTDLVGGIRGVCVCLGGQR